MSFRRVVGVVVVGVLGFAHPAQAGRGAGIIVPPVRVDVGANTPVIGGDAATPGMDLLVGVHWSAIAWKPTSFDVGVGYVQSVRGLVPGYDTLARSVTATNHDEWFALQGMYFSLGRTLVNQPHFRTWIEARGELLRGTRDDRGFSAFGGAVRVAAELYASTVKGRTGVNSIALVVGTVSFGVYVEASHREISRELGPTGFTSGISFRVPFILAGAG